MCTRPCRIAHWRRVSKNLRTHRIVALAGGTSKTRAISAVLKSGLLSGLITDEATASHLLQENPDKESASESAIRTGLTERA